MAVQNKKRLGMQDSKVQDIQSILEDELDHKATFLKDVFWNIMGGNTVGKKKRIFYLNVALMMVTLFPFPHSPARASEDLLFGGKHDDEIAQLLVETSRKVNAQLPIMIDKDTRLDTTIALGKQLYYKYTLVNVSVDEIFAKDFIDRLEAMEKYNHCNNKDMTTMLKLGVVYFYIVSDKNGRLVGQIKISAESCRW